MASNDDQPRPDLDAAVDAVVPSLTAVSDEAIAASLRRTRIALAETAPARDGLGLWRWGLAAAAALLIGLASALVLWPSRTPQPGSVVERRPASPAVVTTQPAPSTPSVAALPVAPKRVASAEPAAPRPERGRSVPVLASSAVSTTPESSRPDPLIALVRAVQKIPEDAWNRSVADAEAPVIVPDVPVTSIDVTPLASPADMAIEPLAPGEP